MAKELKMQDDRGAQLDMELRDKVRDLLEALDGIGFNDPDESVNGGDCVDVINGHIEGLRACVAVEDKRPKRKR